ncbi:hypothetical protein ACIOD1_12820 [Streptomyces sp. NPDC088097]|uniref:hypothetical protein n=1 Tax=Streptomyces sp. NPDC088097 TaxID=3365823 RepID=UPI0037FDBF29
MSGPSKVPAGVRPGRPGVTWEATTARVEQHIDDDAPDPTPNRVTRRAAARAARKRNR